MSFSWMTDCPRCGRQWTLDEFMRLPVYRKSVDRDPEGNWVVNRWRPCECGKLLCQGAVGAEGVERAIEEQRAAA